MLAHRLRRWSDTKEALAQRLVSGEYVVIYTLPEYLLTTAK